MTRFAILIVATALMASQVSAASIRNACLKSDRGRDQPRLCRCIQQAADQTLTRRDQSRAADFFSDPERAQRMRRSDQRSHEKFWDRYERFGAFAVRSCRLRG